MRFINLCLIALVLAMMAFLAGCDDGNDGTSASGENNPPAASFTVATDGLNVATDASASSDIEDGSNIEVSWDWGDATTSDFTTTRTAEHTYAAAGTYTITLTARDTEGLTTTTSQDVTVTENGINTSPTASFTVNPESGNTETVFTVDASASSDAEDSASALEVRWNWGDGTTTDFSTDKTATHTYAADGTYTIILEVRDSGGLTATATRDVLVTITTTGTPPVASFTVDPTSGTTATSFHFDASGSTDAEDPTSALAVRWDWENDGTWDTEFSTDKTISHTFATPDTYTVKLQVKDTDNLTDTTTRTVTVTAVSSDVTITISPTKLTIGTGCKFQFHATVSGTSNTDVIWKVLDASDQVVPDAITDSGLFTAPNEPGTYKVVAISAADESKYAVATVCVNPAELIAFVRSANGFNGKKDIYTMTPDGQHQTKITSGDSVTLSPDGKWMIYTLFSHLKLISLDGSSTEAIDLGIGYCPSFSADGSKVVFTTANHNPCVMYRDGSDKHIYTNIEDCIDPKFSPDGSTIVYWRITPPNGAISVLDLVSGKVTDLANVPNTTYRSPVFSPDGCKIAYYADPPAGQDQSGIYLMNSDGSEKKLISASSGAYGIAFSPDGNTLCVGYPTGSKYGLKYLDLGGGLSGFITTGHDMYPCWRGCPEPEYAAMSRRRK